MSRSPGLREILSRRGVPGAIFTAASLALTIWRVAGNFSTGSYVLDIIAWFGDEKNANAIAKGADLFVKWGPFMLLAIGLAWLYYVATHPRAETASASTVDTPAMQSPSPQPVEALQIVAPQEPPGAEIVPVLLPRLPNDQRQLLLSLNLGEKVLSEDEPGLGDLEKNGLVQRICRVTAREYLFRVHPANVDAVKSFFAPEKQPPVASVGQEPPKLPYEGDIERLREVQRFWRDAINFTCEYITTDFAQYQNQNKLTLAGSLFAELLRTYVKPPCREAQRVVDLGLSVPEPMSSLTQRIREMLEAYAILVYFIERCCPVALGDTEFYGSPEYNVMFRRHKDLIEMLRSVRMRTDFGVIAADVYNLEQLLRKPPLNAI
jgi:hypothetical protein